MTDTSLSAAAWAVAGRLSLLGGFALHGLQALCVAASIDFSITPRNRLLSLCGATASLAADAFVFSMIFSMSLFHLLRPIQPKWRKQPCPYRESPA
jgi:hypothetical protein